MLGAFGRLLSLLNFLASLLILAIMLIITTDVLGRVLFGTPLYGVPEITKLSIVCIVWLQMGYALRERQHLRSNLILGALPRLGQRTVLILNAAAGMAILGLIALYSYPELVRAWSTGAFEGEHPMRIPTWPIWLIVIIGSALTAIEYLVQLVQNATGGGAQIEAEIGLSVDRS